MNLAISVLAIFSNVGIVCFTSKSFGDENQILSFLFFVFASLAFKFLLYEFIPEVPEKVWIVQERHKYIVNKLLKDVGSKKSIDIERVRINQVCLFTEAKKLEEPKEEVKENKQDKLEEIKEVRA